MINLYNLGRHNHSVRDFNSAVENNPFGIFYNVRLSHNGLEIWDYRPIPKTLKSTDKMVILSIWKRPIRKGFTPTTTLEYHDIMFDDIKALSSKFSNLVIMPIFTELGTKAVSLMKDELKDTSPFKIVVAADYLEKINNADYLTRISSTLKYSHPTKLKTIELIKQGTPIIEGHGFEETVRAFQSSKIENADIYSSFSTSLDRTDLSYYKILRPEGVKIHQKN